MTGDEEEERVMGGGRVGEDSVGGGRVGEEIVGGVKEEKCCVRKTYVFQLRDSRRQRQLVLN